MKVLFYSGRPYDKISMESVNNGRHELNFISPGLDERTASLAKGFPAVCGFVNDQFSADCLKILAEGGTKLVLLRSTGFNNVDLSAAEANGITVMRVLSYSPYSVAEHAIALAMALNRKLVRAYNRNREGYFLLDGLLGFDFNGKTFGIAGTGKIGTVLAKIANGLGCTLLGFDPYPSEACKALGMTYVPFKDLLQQSDIISLHMPLTLETHHIINKKTLALMKPGAMLINTSRGPLIDSAALVDALKSRHIGAAALDVYEEEEDVFYHDVSSTGIDDDVLARLLTFPNVIVTSHQAYFTQEALRDIATATMQNVTDFEAGNTSTPNALRTVPART